jgi:DNA-binding beta-propeller fold protein YncE
MAELRDLLREGLGRFDPSADRGLERTIRRVHHRQRNRRITAAVVAVLVFAGTATGVWAWVQKGGRAVPAAPRPLVTASLDLGEGVSDVAIADGEVWVATEDGAKEIDQATATVVATVNLGTKASHRMIAVDSGVVWLTNPSENPSEPDQIAAIDAAHPQEVVGLKAVNRVLDLAAGGGYLWVLAGLGLPAYYAQLPTEVLQIDPATLRIVTSTPLASPSNSDLLQSGPAPGRIAFGAGGVWVSTLYLHQGGRSTLVVYSVDPAAHALGPVLGALNGTAGFLATGGGAVWLAAQSLPGPPTVRGFDPSAGTPVGPTATLPVFLTDLAASDTGVWATDQDGRVWRLDPKTGKLAGGPLNVASGLGAIATDSTGAWAIGGNHAYRIELCPASGCQHPTLTPTTPSPTVPTLVPEDVMITEAGEFPSDFTAVTGGEILPASNFCMPALTKAPSVTLYGWIAPVAVPSAETGLIAYNTWDRIGGTPSIRVRSRGCGEDFVWEEDAASFAWSQSGDFAYVQLASLGDACSFCGQILVGVSPAFHGAPIPSPIPWTTSADRWIVAAWAQDRLLVYRELEGEALELYVLDGPGQMRRLGPSDTNDRLVAVSPDGSQAFVGLGEGGNTVAVYDLASGRELSRLDMSGMTDPKTNSTYGVIYAGSWAGDVVAASGDPGLLLFRVTDGMVALTRVLRIADGIYEPQLLDTAGTSVVGWQHLVLGGADRYRLLACNPDVPECVATRPIETSIYMVYNPSRPSG